MKRLFPAGLLGILLSSCMHPWVGRPVKQLEREMGLPYRIRNEGENRVYVYPDILAGRGQMTFTIDRNGIIRSWYATTDVPGAFSDGPFGDGSNDGFGTNGANGGLNGPLNSGR
jgi:hypothetical protein